MDLRLSLATLGNGAAEELFQRELQSVLGNIADPNTIADDTRKITLEVRILPDVKRRTASVDISCSSKLAKCNGHCTNIYFANDNGEYIAVENNPEQMQIGFAPQQEEAHVG